LGVAARHARRADEAQDLLHDSLLAAAEAQRADLRRAENRAWFAGLIRNKAALAARTAVRRRRREALVIERSAPRPAEPATPSDDDILHLVRALPPGTRAVATLALHGMTRPEIACALGLSDAALRQRLTTLRRKWEHLSGDVQDGAIAYARSRQRTIAQKLEPGPMRRALLALLRWEPGVGTHDPDGHLIVIRDSSPASSQAGRARQQM
jgi:RNA polymerase sigma-70 factor (ECF subfamily)